MAIKTLRPLLRLHRRCLLSGRCQAWSAQEAPRQKPPVFVAVSTRTTPSHVGLRHRQRGRGAARGVCGVRRNTFCRFPLFASHRFRPSHSPRKKPRLSVPTGICSRAEATPRELLCLATRHVVASSRRVLGTRVLRRSSANRLNYHVPIASRKYSRPRAEAQNSLLAAASSRRFPQKGNFTGTTTT